MLEHHHSNLAKIKISIFKFSPSEIFLESMLKTLDNSGKFILLWDDWEILPLNINPYKTWGMLSWLLTGKKYTS